MVIAPSFAPITFSFGFLEAPLGVVADELGSWYQRAKIPRSLLPTGTRFPESLRLLEPLTAPGFHRLWIATTSPRWQTAYFDGSINGGDPFPPISYLAQQLGCHGLVVTSCPDTPQCYGANNLDLYGPTETDWLNLVWTVSAMNDGGRWLWRHSGPTYEFEDAEAYSARRVRDRFDAARLGRYCQALGVPLDPAQYLSSALLDKENGPRPLRSESLEEARKRFGLSWPPGKP